MIKKQERIFLLILTFTPCLAPHLVADQPETGWALCYESDNTGLYATHKTLPFGTELLLTSRQNNKQVTVRVGGRLEEDSGFLIEISPDAGEKLGINVYDFAEITAAQIIKENKPRAMRARIGGFTQVGVVTTQSGGMELTAFHPSLPMQSQVRLTNTSTGRSVTVTINGRIRASKDKIAEISVPAAQALGIRSIGVVLLERVDN